MHPINYKSSDINSSLQIYFQILWVTNQFSDVNIFYEMPIGSLNIRLDSENHCIRKGNGDPLRYIFYFYLRAHVYSNKKDKLNKIFLINVFFFFPRIDLLKKYWASTPYHWIRQIYILWPDGAYIFWSQRDNKKPNTSNFGSCPVLHGL